MVSFFFFFFLDTNTRDLTVQGKHTQNVRRIFQSQKTFANHLDDFLAFQALQESNAAAAAAGSKRAANKKETPGSGAGTPLPDGTSSGATGDADSADKPSTLLEGSWGGPLPSLPGDADPLLMSRVPLLPTDEELRTLLAAPPLSFGDARGTWEETYPTRVFCEVCGYWGRVRCMKCGARICALDCLEVHREECFTRYGM
jgi:zinc finger HIT domain-containing protein 1